MILLLRLQSHNYEERYRTVEGELRKLVAMRGKSLSHFMPCLLQVIPEMDLCLVEQDNVFTDN